MSLERRISMQRRLLQHAAKCSHMISTSLVVDDELTDEYHNLGILYQNQGKLAKAQAMYERALAGYEKAVGPDHPRSQSLQDKLSALDADIKNKALAAVEES
jgi:tetratricopeptide (TPR) repeat protein